MLAVDVEARVAIILTSVCVCVLLLSARARLLRAIEGCSLFSDRPSYDRTLL